MSRLRRFGLPERLLAILLLVALIDFVANTVVFQRASSFELRHDDATRIAENLVLASRAIERTSPADRQQVAGTLSTRRFSLHWSRTPARPSGSVSFARLREQVVRVEPSLGKADLQLHLNTLAPTGNIGGSIVLRDGSVLAFRTYARSALKLNVGRVASMTLPTVLLLVLAWVLFRATLDPLRALVRATRKVGSGPPQPVIERGTGETRELIRAFNQMQERIHQSLIARTQSMLAIGHDLRTPLARMRLRLDNPSIDPETRDGMTQDIEEMHHLLASLQAFVDTNGSSLKPERIDIAAMASTLVDTATDQGGDVAYHGPDSLEIVARPVSLRRALSNLIENALHYGGNARVSVRRNGGTVEIAVEDDGPGIPDDRLGDVLEPFVRLDTARARNTPGMGLGLPIVRSAVKLEGGTLFLANSPEGGLRVTIQLPRAVA